MTTHEEFESIAALDAIGAADAGEAEALRVHLESCPDCRRVRDDYSEAASLLARQLDPVTPPGDVRARIVSSAEDEEDGDAADDGEVVVADHRFVNWWLATAATLFLALWGWRELAVRAQKARITDQDATIKQLTEQNELLDRQRQKLSTAVAAVAGADTRTIALAGQQIAPSASAKVFLDSAGKRAVVFFNNMPVNPTDHSYQLWIIRADQPKPQSAGVFDVAPNGRASVTVENLPVAAEIKALAVTLEPRGGGEQPSNANYFVLGGSS
jgi:anti-sigma-K factor RskA